MRAAEQQAHDAQQSAAAERAKQQSEADVLYRSQVPKYENLLNFSYPEATKTAMTTSEMGATAEPFAEAGRDAENRAATTRNASGTEALEDQLAMQKGSAMGKTAAGLQTQFQDETDRNRAIGLQGLYNLYNLQQNAALGYNSSQAPLLNAQIEAGKSQWFDVVKGLIGAGGQIGAAAL